MTEDCPWFERVNFDLTKFLEHDIVSNYNFKTLTIIDNFGCLDETL